MNNFERLIKLLKDRGVKYEILDAGTDDSSVDAHVKAFGIGYTEGLSTLVFVDESGQYFALLRRDDRNVDFEKLKQIVEVENIRFANEKEIKKFGFEPGLASPFLLRELMPDIQIFVDDKVLEMDGLVCGTTLPNKGLKTTKEEVLSNIGEYEVIEVTVPNPKRQSVAGSVAIKDLSDKVIVSGITPSSAKGLHLGNYLGAVKGHVEMQDKVKHAFYFIADYHSLNMVHDPEQVRSNVLNTYLDYLSLGLDLGRDNVTFYIESGVPEICEMNIILNNVVTMAELKRMHAYKDKFEKGVNEDSINHGLFNYPVLMASDIIIFNADIVPVGEDQKQHVEIAREIAQSFNHRYGNVVTVPDVYIKKETARVVGIDGVKKMSKSLGNDIPIFGSEEEVRKQIFAVTTDPNRIHPTDPGDPAKNPIFSYMDLLGFDQGKRADFIERYKAGTVGDMEIKKAFYEFFLEYFGPMRKKREQLANDLPGIKKLIEKNNAEARMVAIETIKLVRKAVGVD